MLVVKIVFSFAIFAVSYGYSTTPASSYCSGHYDCPGSQMCCRPIYIWSANKCADTCLGNSCNMDDDCGWGEYCCDNTCRSSCRGTSTTPGYRQCNDNSDCSGSQACCRPNLSANKCAYTCLGNSCYGDDDCGSGEYCCDNTCRLSCLGRSCLTDADCGGPNEYCCNYSCHKGSCALPSGIIAAIVLAVVVVTATIVGVALFVYRFHMRRSTGVIVHRQPMVTAVPATTMIAGSHVNYDAGPPPPYVPPQLQPQPQPQPQNQPMK